MNIQPINGGNIHSASANKTAETFVKISLGTDAAASEVRNSPDAVMKMLFSDLKGLLQFRTKLIESLPASIKQFVQNTLQNSSGMAQVNQGLTVLSKTQRVISEQLLTMESLMRETIQLRQMPLSEQPPSWNQEGSRFKINSVFVFNQLNDLSVEQIESAASALQKLAVSKDVVSVNTLLASRSYETLPFSVKQVLQSIFQADFWSGNINKEFSALPRSQDIVPEQLQTMVSLLREVTRLRQTPVPEQPILLNREMVRSIEVWQQQGLFDVSQLNDLSNTQLTQTADSLRELALSMQKSATPTALLDSSTQVFSLAIPLFFSDNPRPYPVYIHVYNEDKSTGDADENIETWIRLCVDTENIGFVDIAFQMYRIDAVSRVNLRILFDTEKTTASFAEGLSNFRSIFDQLSLKLNDVAINTLREGKNG